MGVTMSLALEKAIQDWPTIKEVFSIPKTEAQFRRLVKAMDELLDRVGENEEHPLIPLLETIASLVDIYENENVNLPTGKPIDVVRHYMELHELTQKDMTILGSQGVVSELLSGKRSLNAKQIKALAKRFGVSPAVFL